MLHSLEGRFTAPKSCSVVRVTESTAKVYSLFMASGTLCRKSPFSLHLILQSLLLFNHLNFAHYLGDIAMHFIKLQLLHNFLKYPSNVLIFHLFNPRKEGGQALVFFRCLSLIELCKKSMHGDTHSINFIHNWLLDGSPALTSPVLDVFVYSQAESL